ncbi:glycogen/starch/alpha-glucan phosphorylase [Desulfitobacterium sp. Sab5]|uniref:glycogen/starch/alpha-glucan phosphorylase n=1 Tax=Desulfitobacterium nosdiversum TaxID=3375356 RepID=UPI003CEA0781
MFFDKESFKQAYLEKFAEAEGKTLDEGTSWDKYHALVLLLKEKISLCRALSNEEYSREKEKQVYYFSMEFLIGKLLPFYLVNMEIYNLVREGLVDLNINLEYLLEQESDAGLGNGGLGRLAACFLDSMSFKGVKGHGNGIHYKYGLFEQKLVNGFQAEVADNWLKNGYPWEMRKPDKSVVVKYKGKVRIEYVNDKLNFIHENYEPILAVPYDIPVFSYRNPFYINNLRLWSAEPMTTGLDLELFNRGEFNQAISYKSEVEAISYILYPEDSHNPGRELRLKQEYFFVAAGLGSILRSYKKSNSAIHEFANWVAIHINDTHAALCIPELMRLLMDEEGLEWDEAWEITVNSTSYTNHTILPEALEKWPVVMVRYLFPRIYMIIEEIDRRYRENIRKRFPKEPQLSDQTAIIQGDLVHMAHLAIIGSHSVNGVADLHTRILKGQIFTHLNQIYPNRLNNKTNGVSHRRFLYAANHELSQLITEAIGPHWKRDAGELQKLKTFAYDSSFIEQLARIKTQNKHRLVEQVRKRQGIELNPYSLFDVQVKRIHAYKRQLLNVFKIMNLYNHLKANPNYLREPQTFIFAGKAAPGYHYAKTLIKLINSLAQKINQDKDVNEMIKLVFLENFNVTLGELVYPAADISEQISTAGKEASGTGNMKFMMNGAITLGTLDGANVEIREAVGDENIFIFGLKAEEVLRYSLQSSYKSWDEYLRDPQLKRILDQLVCGYFQDVGGEFIPIHDSLLHYNDEFFVLKDFNSYYETYLKMLNYYSQKSKWFQSTLINIAESGRFSSDRTIKEYAEGIWNIHCR